MKIVVIVVTYNGAQWYQKCFDSLRNSTVPVEVVVVDNNSSDDTVPFLKANYPEIYLIPNNQNLGFGKANNLGIQYAIDNDANYVYLLNQDAWVKPDAIEKLALAMNKTPEYGVISPMHLSGDEQKIDYNQMHHISPVLCPDLATDCLLSNGPTNRIYEIAFVNAAHWMLSIDCVKTVGGFSPLFFLYGEDDNYLHRVKYFKYKIGFYPKAIAIHDRHETQRKRLSYTKKVNKEYATVLQKVANIQIPFCNRIRDVIHHSLSGFLYCILFIKLRSSLVHLHVLTKVLFNTPNIIKHRKTSKHKGAYIIVK